jgi:hypothetical protein
MKKLIVLIAIAGVAMFALLGRGHKDNAPVAATAAPPPMPKPARSEPRPAETVADIVKSANANLPAMVDKQTRLDKVESGPGEQLTYLYTLPFHASSDVSGYWITSEVQPKVTRDVCDTPVLRRLLANGATLVYAYKGKDGVDINRFRIRDGDCVRIGFK